MPDAHDPVTGEGRWLYEGRLGEGGLATVFKAWDCKAGLGSVAVKVLKRHSKAGLLRSQTRSRRYFFNIYSFNYLVKSIYIYRQI